MYLSDKPLHISVDIVDMLFIHALRDSVARATPPSDAWNHIEQAVQRLPAQEDLNTRHLHRASYMPLTKI
jgi:hypothetical protein